VEHRSTLVTAGNLADVLRHEGKNSEAQSLIQETLEIERRTLGNEHSDTLNSMEVLGQVLTAQGLYAEADKILREAYDTRLRVLGKDHHDTAGSAYDLGALYAAEGKKAEALAMLTSAVDHGLLPKKDLDMGTDPELKSLKGDPAFEALLADARRHAGSSPN